ncbi:hypothetical protein [Curvibacter lanceolatus]|uniref:hypothetical protein n=1 Tax=Curvibacter lanceolatus TaxID=86182 RepID=UPI00037048C8|nr:hypothetical protein [Curvibacter lanceolatus]
MRAPAVPTGPSAERPLLTVAWVAVLAFFFAQVEIQIEGGAGWAAALPTWRIEQHWLLDIFWGGRAMTGYHAWIFSFMVLMFHFPLAFLQTWSWRLQARALACIMQFWVMEDFLWFVLNPDFGLARFDPQNVPWQKHWWWWAPTDYWTFSAVAIVLFWLSFKAAGPPQRAAVTPLP